MERDQSVQKRYPPQKNPATKEMKDQDHHSRVMIYIIFERYFNFFHIIVIVTSNQIIIDTINGSLEIK